MDEEYNTSKMTLLSNPVLYITKIMFFTKGKGIHKDYLTSFELALRDASISDLNLVSVSSIKTPHCKIVNRDEGRNTSCQDKLFLRLWPSRPPMSQID